MVLELLFRNVSAIYEKQTTTIQFCVLVVGVFIFFGIHNYLQEAIMHVPEFHKHGVMLGYFEVFGVAICSYMERTHIVKERGRKAPISAYPLLTLCLVSSSALSNMSLSYINYPTKVVFRSCKLIPTMIIASIVNKQIYTSVEYLCAIGVCIGLVMFGAADWDLSPSFDPTGLVLVSMSVCADALLPNAQERLFHQYSSSRLEVTLYTNVFVLGIMTLSTLLSGDLLDALHIIYNNPLLQIYFLIYTFIAYIAISFHMNVVKRFGGVAAVLVATGRKAMTLILSFILFPKAFSWYYPIGSFLVLGGLTISSLLKSSSKSTSHSSNGTPRHGISTNGTTAHSHNEEIIPLAKINHHDSDLPMSGRKEIM